LSVMILLGIRRLRDFVATLPVHRRHYLVLLWTTGNRATRPSPRKWEGKWEEVAAGSFDRLKPPRANSLCETTYPGEQPIQVIRRRYSPRSSPARLGPRVAAFQALVEVAHHRGHQHVDLAVEEVVGGWNDARIDHDALLGLKLLDQAD